jgi:hypothetical protein
MLKLGFFIILSLAIVVVLIRQVETRAIFFPMKGTPPVVDGALAHEDVFFQTADGKTLHGWFVPAPASRDKASVVLFLHGNAGNIGHRWDKIDILHELGVAVFIFDYRGYGRSEGRPTEAGIYKDADAAHAYLTGRGIAPENIILYGESIGGAFAVDLAMKKSVKALILEGTLTSVPEMVRMTMPFIPRFILATQLNSLPKIRQVRCAKLILHSVDDEIVPFEMGKALFDSAPEPKRFVRLRGGHNTAFFDDNVSYKNALREFLSPLI